MRQPARQFAPSRHALGLHQLLLLHRQRAGHIVERSSQLPDFIRPAHINSRVPPSRRDFTRAFGQLFHRPRDARRHPQAPQQAHKNRRPTHGPPNRHHPPPHHHHFLPRPPPPHHPT